MRKPIDVDELKKVFSCVMGSWRDQNLIPKKNGLL